MVFFGKTVSRIQDEGVDGLSFNVLNVVLAPVAWIDPDIKDDAFISLLYLSLFVIFMTFLCN